MPAEQPPSAVLPEQLTATLAGHDGAVLNVRFNPKGTYSLSCGKVRSQHVIVDAPTTGLCDAASLVPGAHHQQSCSLYCST